MTASELVARCRAQGIDLTVGDGRLRFRAPAGALDPDLKAALAGRRGEVIALLTGRCPGCGRPTNAHRQCWHCHDMACRRCGSPTGSALISHCYPCQRVAEGEGRL